jgi:hypothetical protein
MPVTTGLDGLVFPSGGGLVHPPKGLVDPGPQALGHPLATPLGDHDAKLGLELEGIAARGALHQMTGDDDPSLVAELAVEVLIEQ